MTEPDMRRLPSGNLEWQALIDVLSQAGDRAERYYVELKSEVDLNTRAAKAKVAKFILGAANRLPEKAADKFGGHALLVLGISHGNVTGIPHFEAHHLAREVAKFTGTPGPGWDYTAIRTANPERDVVVVYAMPPVPGAVWLCKADGDGLANGELYVRADGETRKATGQEGEELWRRAREPHPEVELLVEAEGVVHCITWDDALLGSFLFAERARLERAFNSADGATGFTGPAATAEKTRMLSALFEVEPEDRSPEQYREEISAWEEGARLAWPSLCEALSQEMLPAVMLRVRNGPGAFLEDVELRVHLEGEVRAAEKLDVDTPSNPFDELPKLPREWGPKVRNRFPGLGMHLPGPLFRASDLAPRATSFGPRYGSVDWSNDGSVNLKVPFKDLRPNAQRLSEEAEFVLLLDGGDAETVRGTWQVTARGHHRAYEGVLTIPVERDYNTNAVLQTLLEEYRSNQEE